MRRLLRFVIVCVWLGLPWAAPAHAAKGTNAFDLYQASVNASDCKISFFLNGERIEFLSGDGSHGMSASAPLSALDLVKENKIAIVVEAVQAEPSITLNVQGINLDDDAVVDTRAPGDVLRLELGADKIRSAKKKEWSAQFTANLRGYYQPFTDEKQVIDYAVRLLGLFQKLDYQALAAELLPAVRKEAKPGATDEELEAEAVQGLKGMLAGAVFKPVDPKKVKVACQASLICRPFVGDEPMLKLRPKGNAPNDFEPIRIGIAKIGGKLQVVRFMERD
jgi:hypothetical protein